MTESKYNLSNFEANIDKYLDSILISRTLKRTGLRFFKDYCSYLKLTFPAGESGNPERLISAKTITAYKSVFNSKNQNRSRWNNFESILQGYKSYLLRQQNIYLSISDNNDIHQKVLNEFINYLEKKSFSDSTIKNYKADLKQLFTYLELNGYSLEEMNEPEILSSFAHNLISKYNLAAESVKRKLSCQATFFSWYNKKKLAPKNRQPITEVISHEITEIKPKLLKKEYTPSGFKNVPDKSSFLARLFYPFLIIILSVLLSLGIFNSFYQKVSTPQAATVTPKTPTRILSFQGRLTASDGSPIIDKTDISFRLWDNATGGNQLYDSGNCSITPDQNGIFYSIIGSTCGKEIGSPVFTENATVFLGLTVGTDNEMEPRSQIASVGYALNSETVGGLHTSSPGVASSIPYINKDGQLLLGTPNPEIRAISGSFSLKGKSVTIAANEGSQGSINLVPDGNGSVNINLAALFPASGSGLLNVSGTNIISGNLISAIGSSLTAGYKLIDLSSGNPVSTKFSVDANGNTYIAGNLITGNSFASSTSGTLVKSDLDITGRIFDGGLGVFGSKGNKLTTGINFSKDTVIEFNFKTKSEKIDVTANINDDNSKFYQFSWDNSGKMEISKCTPLCTTLSQDTFSWSNDSWHDGYISFSGTNLKWSIDKGGKTINATLATDVPSLSSGYLKFSDTFAAINNLVISPTTDLVLTAGNSWIGGRLAIEDNFTTKGRIGIGTENPVEKLDVEGNVEIDASTTTYTQRLCHSGADGDTNDLKLGDCVGNGGADFAEYYGSDTDSEAGDIVAIKQGAFQIDLPRLGKTSKAFVTKSNTPYQNNIVGVISTNPYSEILAEGVFTDSDNPQPVALAGRIPIKVSTENGELKTGDLLTSGNLKGFGMRADWSGQIVGKALEDWPGNGANLIPCPPQTPQNIQCGRILVFLNISYYNKPISEDDLAKMTIIPQRQGSFLSEISALIDNKLNSLSSGIETEKLKSAVIEADNIKTQNLSVGFISPLSEKQEIKILGNTKVFGELNATSLSAETASISGTLSSENLKTDNLKADNATVSGTLYADNIESRDINSLKSSFGEIIEKLNNLTPTPGLSPSPSATPAISPSPTVSPTPIALTPTESPVSTSSAEIDDLITKSNQNSQELMAYNDRLKALLQSEPLNETPVIISPESLVKIDNEIKFTKPISLADTSIAGELLVDGQIMVNQSTISTLTDTLFINSPKLIDIMGGNLLVDVNGNLTVKGELLAEKSIKTGEIKGIDNHINIDLGDNEESSLSADRIGGTGELTISNGINNIATIDASGDAKFSGQISAWKLTLDSPASSGSAERSLTASENFLENGINSPGLQTAKTAGSAVIPASYQEIVVYPGSLTKDSLIYTTATSSTQNRTLYIAKKEICAEDPARSVKCRPYFTVALDSASMSDITFNWWIIN